MINQADTAILFFSRTAAEEAAVKVFDSSLSYQDNKAISRSLISHSLDICRKSSFPLFQYFSDNQNGSSFGEKLSNAIENVFSLGFENVIAVGSDCPFITTDMLQKTAKELTEKQLVLGPAKDGGVYLLGINKSAYKSERFISLAWNSKLLQSDFKLYAEETELTINWLDQYSDIDCEKEFKIALKSLSKSSLLYKTLLDILNCGFVNFQNYLDNYTSISQCVHSQRGPPLAA